MDKPNEYEITLIRGIDSFDITLSDDKITIDGDWRMLLNNELIEKIENALIETGYFDECGNEMMGDLI